MKYVLWILQVLLAVAFVGAGASKVITPAADLVEQGMSWINLVPAFVVPIIGIVEVAGGLGLILPWLTGIQPQLVRLAAFGLVLTMIGAIITHLAVGDPIITTIAPLVLGVLAAVIVYGRTTVLPLT